MDQVLGGYKKYMASYQEVRSMQLLCLLSAKNNCTACNEVSFRLKIVCQRFRHYSLILLDIE
jgi:hypothetical protein